MHEAIVMQARPVPGIPAGKVGMWWFLASEIMVFGGLIGCYILLRLASEGWAATAAHLSLPLASMNTLVLLTSSLTMVLAFAAVEQGERRKVRLFLLLTVLLGLVFLGIKAYEYSTKLASGFTPLTGLFWSFYYAMTGLHALHVLGGVVVNFILLLMALGKGAWPKVQHRVELAGLYWHFVDIVWIFLFPLIYMT
ncbi:MAG TPA: cytochrome c oxidase subunit 3 [Alphaproteobacteria bacterium]|nr:cytochrome c oxidase subunit 3 [Alphaproteobacteria bacterium]